MKQKTSRPTRQIERAAPPLAEDGPSYLDGQTFAGDRGLLAVALHPKSLSWLRRCGKPTHWLLPVENIALVRDAADLPGEVLWICSRPPSTVLGQLDSGLRGAWLDGDQIVINLDGEPQALALSRPLDVGQVIPWLASLVAHSWAGIAAPHASAESVLLHPNPNTDSQLTAA